MRVGDRIIYYIMKLQKFGATATITGQYYHDTSKMWTDKDEPWPARCPSEANIVLSDDELLDAKKLVVDLTFMERKDKWGVYLQGSLRLIPEDDFRLIESEMKKIVSERSEMQLTASLVTGPRFTAEAEYEKAVLALPLESKSIHDRIGEMLESIGTWMDYNTQTRHRIAPEHAYELDVAWLSGRNPEVAIEVQVSGNLTEAKDRLHQARKFNYRKTIMILRARDLERLNRIMKHEPELRSWMEAWSVGAVYEMYTAGERFFSYYRRLREATFRDKKELELVQ